MGKSRNLFGLYNQSEERHLIIYISLLNQEIELVNGYKFSLSF